MGIEELKQAVGEGCRAFGVKRMDVFGSTAMGKETDASDIDLLVEFQEPDHQPAKRYFGLLHHLEDSLGKEVDLLTPNSLKNPYFKKRVMQEKVPVYEG